MPPGTRRQRGFSLILLAFCLVVMLGAMGLAFDLGRMFITRSELQTFCDAAALAAVHELDGTQAGIVNANATAIHGPFGTVKPNGFYFDTLAITNVIATYAATLNGPYDDYATADAPGVNSYRFIMVSATAGVPMSFMGVIPGIGRAYTMKASATAGSQAATSVHGIEPFLPDAHNTADAKNFGFTPGVAYTLKWGDGNGKNSPAVTTCAGDLNWNDPNPAAQHGYVDLGQGNSDSGLRSAIVYEGYPNANSTPSTVLAGQSLSGGPGNRGSNIFSALNERATQDTDTVSRTYVDYIRRRLGNGRRIVTVAVGDPSTWDGNGNGSEMVVGFANFFLDPSYRGNSGPICAIYIGPGNLNGNSTGAGDGSKIYYNVLFK